MTGVVAGSVLTDFVSLGVLASRVPSDAVDDAVAATGKEDRRRGGKLPPHVVTYLVMALALFAVEDYEEVVERLTGAARRGEDLDPALARHVRVVKYEVTDRDGQDALITLVTTITGRQAAPAAVLASACHERWQHETANAQFKTVLRGPGRSCAQAARNWSARRSGAAS